MERPLLATDHAAAVVMINSYYLDGFRIFVVPSEELAKKFVDRIKEVDLVQKSRLQLPNERRRGIERHVRLRKTPLFDEHEMVVDDGCALGPGLRATTRGRGPVDLQRTEGRPGRLSEDRRRRSVRVSPRRPAR